MSATSAMLLCLLASPLYESILRTILNVYTYPFLTAEPKRTNQTFYFMFELGGQLNVCVGI